MVLGRCSPCHSEARIGQAPLKLPPFALGLLFRSIRSRRGAAPDTRAGQVSSTFSVARVPCSDQRTARGAGRLSIDLSANPPPSPEKPGRCHLSERSDAEGRRLCC